MLGDRWEQPPQPSDNVFGSFVGREIFCINRLAKVGVAVNIYALYDSARYPLRPRLFDFSPALDKPFFDGR